jgi:hypothetical protein
MVVKAPRVCRGLKDLKVPRVCKLRKELTVVKACREYRAYREYRV